MKALLVILFFCSSLTCWASGPSLKIFVVPPAHKLQWNSTMSLFKSLLKSQAKALRGNNFSDAQRKTIGHVMAKIECPSEIRWTSISIKPSKMFPLLLKNGVRGIFSENSNGYMQTEAEIKKFIVNNPRNAIVMKFSLGVQTCEEMLKLDDRHREQKKIWFGPMINTLDRYQSAGNMGGSGSTYVVALKRLDDSTFIDLNQWKEDIKLPGSNDCISFYSVQGMWDYATAAYKESQNRHFLEVIGHKNKKVWLKGIEF